jgi:hypothetical protein
MDAVRIPVLADRDDYWGTEAYARNWSYPTGEMFARHAVRDHAFSPGGLTNADVARLRALGRPVFVISNPGSGEPPHLHSVLVVRNVVVWKLLDQ